jgi:hypothetical protein
MKATTCINTLAALTAGAIVTLTAQPAGASIINGGFETGDLTGWTVTLTPGGTAAAVGSHVGAGLGTIYSPVQGSYFAEIKTDGPGNFEMLSQTITLAAGQTLAGFAAFDYGDFHNPSNPSQFNDKARIEVLDGSMTVIATPWQVQGINVPEYWDGPWTAWSWTATTAGNYSLRVGIENSEFGTFDSFALFDAFVVVPETSTILAGAFLTLPLGLQFLRRLRRA